MLQFTEGRFSVIDPTIPVPDWNNNQVMHWSDKYERAGWTKAQSFGADTGLVIVIHRKDHKSPNECLIDIDVCDRPLEIIYCPNAIASLECLIKLAPLLSVAISNGLVDELDCAADEFDRANKPVGGIGGISGLFVAMANRKK